MTTSMPADAVAGFYAAALDAAERALLPAAREVEGLDEEIALLRVRLRTAVAEHPEDFGLLESGVRLLVQSLLAQHRISSREARGLTDAVGNLIERFGDVMQAADV